MPLSDSVSTDARSTRLKSTRSSRRRGAWAWGNAATRLSSMSAAELCSEMSENLDTWQMFSW
eukprot:14926464-Alexandrium_andersonii.AAC.1